MHKIYLCQSFMHSWDFNSFRFFWDTLYIDGVHILEKGDLSNQPLI
jgi:hypothetical protein